MAMTTAAGRRRGCSPWAMVGCGCGLLAMIGIGIIFLLLGVQFAQGRRSPSWSREDYARCAENLQVLGGAIASYEEDTHHLPRRLVDLEARYLDTPDRLQCPLQRRGIGRPYQFYPEAALPTDPLIRCDNHRQGPLILLRNGKVKLIGGR